MTGDNRDKISPGDTSAKEFDNAVRYLGARKKSNYVYAVYVMGYTRSEKLNQIMMQGTKFSGHVPTALLIEVFESKCEVETDFVQFV